MKGMNDDCGSTERSRYHGSGKQMEGVWYDPLTGARENCSTDGRNLLAPSGFAEDAVLHLSPR